jgi:outer membrane receptor protein involved in Fe transport
MVFSAYLLSKTNLRHTMRLYDDLSALYCDVDVEGMGELFYGVETAGKFRLTDNLELSLSASAGRYIYSENPTITHYDDRDGRVVSRSLSYMGDCYIGGAPQLSAMAQLTYFTYRGWVLSCSGQGVAMRYVDPSVIRRTERVAQQASLSPEIYHRFISQGRLSNAITMDMSVSRWFDLAKGRLSLTLSVRNLLGNGGVEYGGYEQSRIRNYQSGANRVYLPMDDMITYAYGRTYYLVISFKM